MHYRQHLVQLQHDDAPVPWHIIETVGQQLPAFCPLGVLRQCIFDALSFVPASVLNIVLHYHDGPVPPTWQDIRRALRDTRHGRWYSWIGEIQQRLVRSTK